MRADDELVTAHADGVAELTPEERRRVETLLATDAAVRVDDEATRALLGALRELPAEGTEPDWTAMERAIAAQVGPDVPRPWWRAAWRWLVPATVLAVAGAALALWLHGAPVDPPTRSTPAVGAPDAGEPPAVALGDDDSVPLWLDGAAVAVDLDADELLAPTADDPDAPGDDDDDATVGDLLPTANLATVDQMSDDELANLEQWLANHGSPVRKKT